MGTAETKGKKMATKACSPGVPAALPSLIKAYRIRDKARNVGFDWEERSQVWEKVKKKKLANSKPKLTIWTKKRLRPSSAM